MSVRACVRACARACVRACVREGECVCVCVYVCVCVCVCVRLCARARARWYISNSYCWKLFQVKQPVTRSLFSTRFSTARHQNWWRNTKSKRDKSSNKKGMFARRLSLRTDEQVILIHDVSKHTHTHTHTHTHLSCGKPISARLTLLQCCGCQRCQSDIIDFLICF